MMSGSAASIPQAGPTRLGLIGDNIRDSRSPDLHRLAGWLCGLEVRYDLLVPAQMGRTFDEVLAACEHDRMRGVNVTYPYKERVITRLASCTPDVTLIGSANTVVFTPEGPVGYNTDHSGFIAAYRIRFRERPAGRVAIIGCGGVGRAIAFALAALGATQLRLFDADADRANRLAAALGLLAPPMAVQVERDPAGTLREADGVVNCTPVGMTGMPGSAVPLELLGGQRWAFDAVYTPVDTQFLRTAQRVGIETLSGYELFFHQGIKAFELFTGRMPPLDALRRELVERPHREVS